ncbi:MAG: hypothetical protein A3F40_02130 [Chlamydiae bacterium RIFCSPHIGHO2_12_FULL_27_8]|nr:MAG: hypothetical protein A3F40_02130 [Chlamydiae bacterium RIFCSPHIGHO2_12_FULL_27_8]
MKRFFILIFLLFSNFSNLRSEENIDYQNQTIISQEADQEALKAPEFKGAFFKMLFMLFALIALIFITFWLFKRFSKVKMHQINLTKNIKILEKRPLSPKTMLYLIEVNGKKLLISESNLEVRPIKDLEIKEHL